jgi:transposase
LLLAPYLTLLPQDAGQCEHSLREVSNGLRYIVKTGAPWRWMPNDLPPWPVVYQQTQCWLAAGCFEALIDDLCAVLRLAAGRKPEPSTVIIDSRTLRSTPESGERGEYDGAKRKKGSKLHIAVDTLARTIQAVTQDSVEIAWGDQGYTERPRRRLPPGTASTSRSSSC